MFTSYMFKKFLDQVQGLEQNFDGVDGNEAVESEMITGQNLRPDDIIEDPYSHQ